MKQFSEQFHKKAIKSVKLQAAEKDDLRDRLTAYMEYHPLPSKMKVTTETKIEKSESTLVTEPFSVLHIPFDKLFKSSLVAVALLLVIVPIVAEKSVPGDTLYAVKVHLNEEIMSTLTFDGYQKVEWETERLNRRIAEARLLASEGRLTEEVEAEVAEAVKEHTANAQREIEVLREQDAEAATIAAITLDTTLEMQATSLKSRDGVVLDSEEDSEIEQSVSLIASAIDESRAQTEEPIVDSTMPSYNKLMAKVEQNTTRIVELITSLKLVASPEDVANITRRAEDIDRALVEVMDVAEENDVEARERLISVLQSTQKLIIFITELEVEKTVDIETLIPVVPTTEEKAEEIAEVIDELAQKYEQISLLVAEVEDEEVIEKVELSQATIAEFLETAATSTDQFEAFVVSSKEVYDLANDSLRILNELIVVTPEITESTSTSTSTTETVIDGAEDESASSTETEVQESLSDDGEPEEDETVEDYEVDVSETETENFVASSTEEEVMEESVSEGEVDSGADDSIQES